MIQPPNIPEWVLVERFCERHTYASHQLSSGVNQQYVAQQMGRSGTALLDVYARWVRDWVGEYQERAYGA
jgi:site-specific recombinase XerD